MTRTAATRVACVGAGYFGRFQCEAWRRLDGAALVAICDRVADRARRMAQEFGIPSVHTDVAAMLDAETPDLIDIVTPPETHLDHVRAAAARGVAAICQKPFCRNLAEAREAVALARGAGIPLVVHENFRFQPWYREIARLLAAGRLGQVFQATFRLRPGDGQGPDAYLDRQPYFQTMERFLVHETGIHLIDTFRFLFGEARRVYASLRRLNPAIAGEDAGLIVLDHAGGVRALFDGNRLVDHAARNRRLTLGELLVEGAAATLRLDGDGDLWLRRAGENDETRHAYAWDDRGFGGDCVHALQRHVLRALRDGGAIENLAEDYLRNLEIEEAVYLSSRTGARIDL